MFGFRYCWRSIRKEGYGSDRKRSCLGNTCMRSDYRCHNTCLNFFGHYFSSCFVERGWSDRGRVVTSFRVPLHAALQGNSCLNIRQRLLADSLGLRHWLGDIGRAKWGSNSNGDRAIGIPNSPNASAIST